MKSYILLALIAIANAEFSEEVEQQWSNFKRQFRKHYSADEEMVRKAVFESNFLGIAEHNNQFANGMKSFSLALNSFADLTTEEFAVQMNGFRNHGNRFQSGKSVHTDDSIAALPMTVDWRTKGVVTPIKNQEACGSCWAFSAVASIEGQHALNKGKLVSLSEQNLVDCSTPEGNQGCNGGLMDQAFEYVMKNGGIDTEMSYPYEAMDDTCRYKKASEGAMVGNFTDIMTGSESGLQSAVAKIGPISVAIDASQFSFQFYSSGVYDEPNCGNKMEDLDHGVTAVGYGTDNGKDYWLVKNSWGMQWGNKGYIQMSRNKMNQCGIATASSYPTMVM